MTVSLREADSEALAWAQKRAHLSHGQQGAQAAHLSPEMIRQTQNGRLRCESGFVLDS